MKSLNGSELAGYIKERQAHQVRSLHARGLHPKLLIIRDSDNPVIMKYVGLKIKYGHDIGVDVEEFDAGSFSRKSEALHSDALQEKIIHANNDPSIHGIIIQLPLTDKSHTDELCNLIAPEKDVDGLGQNAKFDSATATAINWLLTGYNIDLESSKIAIVGRGKLVGAPLYKMFSDSGYDVELFHRGSDLTKLK